MKSVNTYYQDFHHLELFVEMHNIVNTSSLLIQVFTAQNDKGFIETLCHELVTLLPNAIIIGSTTDGEIMSGKVSTMKTVLSFTTFERTQITYAMAKHQKDGYFSGRDMAHALIQKDTKLMIAFADGLATNGEAFLEGIHSVNKSILVAGGLAGDNATFTHTYVFNQEGIIQAGAVAIALHGTDSSLFVSSAA